LILAQAREFLLKRDPLSLKQKIIAEARISVKKT